MFNEVFFDDVFVPDDCLVGQENDGWRCARTTLANERVYMGGSNTIGGGVVGVLRAIEARGREDDTRALDEAGDLVVTGHALAVLGFRMTLQALAGADPSGSEAAVRKLLGVQHDQRVQEVGMLAHGCRTRRSTRATPRAWVGIVPLQPVPDDRRRDERHPAQRHRRAPARAARAIPDRRGGFQPPRSNVATTSHEESCEYTSCATEARTAIGTGTDGGSMVSSIVMCGMTSANCPS